MGPSLSFDWNSKHLLKKVFIILVSCELAIFFLDIIFNHYKLVRIGALRRLFNITREDGLSNFFSSFQLFMVGVLLLVVYWVSREIHENQSKIQEKGWLILACFFAFMGFDDATKFHERIGTTAKVLMKPDGSREVASQTIFDIFPSYAWQVVFGPFFFAMGVFILWFLYKNIKDKFSKKLFIGGLSFYVLAVGMDFVEGYGTGPYKGIAEFLGLSAKQVRHLSKAYEETFEMFGTTLFLICFLKHLFYLMQKSNGLRVKVDSHS